VPRTAPGTPHSHAHSAHGQQPRQTLRQLQAQPTPGSQGLHRLARTPGSMYEPASAGHPAEVTADAMVRHVQGCGQAWIVCRCRRKEWPSHGNNPPTVCCLSRSPAAPSWPARRSGAPPLPRMALPPPAQQWRSTTLAQLGACSLPLAQAQPRWDATPAVRWRCAAAG
jgi:hypothetical protein